LPYLDFEKLVADNNYLITCGWVMFTQISFILLIVVLFLKVNKMSKSINDEIDLDAKLIDENIYLKQDWELYNHHLVDFENIGMKTEDFAEDFFNQSLLYRILNMRFWLGIPGTFVGLGILGTFVGLTFGISGFSMENSVEIQNSIKNLLGGIGTAFLTSLHGIALSIIFGFIEKQQFQKLNNSINQICVYLNNKFKLTKKEQVSFDNQKQINLFNQWEIIFSSHQKDIQKTIFSELTKLNTNITNKIDENVASNKSSLTDLKGAITKKIEEMLVSKNKNGDDITTANMMRDMLSESEKQSQALGSFSTDLAEIIIEKFEESTEKTLLPKFKEILESLKQVDSGIKSFSSSTGEDIGKGVNQAIESLQQELKIVVADFREAFSSGAMQQLDKVVESLDESAIVMENMPAMLNTMLEQIRKTNTDEAENRQELISSEFDKTIDKFSKSIDLIIENLSKAENNRSEREKELLDIMNERIQRKQDAISKDYQDSTNQVKKLTDLMITNLSKLEEQQKNRTENHNKISDEKMNARQKQMSAEFDVLVGSFKNSVSTIVDNLSKAEEKQIEREQTIVNTMNGSLSQTINKIKELLIVQEQSKETIESLLSESSKTIEKGILLSDKYNDNTELLEFVSKDFKRVSVELNNGFNKLNQFSDKLKETSLSFSSDYSKLTVYNTETFENIEKSLSLSKKTLYEFANKFEIIESDLKSIFSEVDKGLKGYSNTTRDAINDTLATFTQKLSLAASSLSGSIEDLNMLFDDIAEKLDK